MLCDSGASAPFGDGLLVILGAFVGTPGRFWCGSCLISWGSYKLCAKHLFVAPPGDDVGFISGFGGSSEYLVDFSLRGVRLWFRAKCGISCQAPVPELKQTSQVILIAVMQQKAIRQSIIYSYQ